MKILVMSLLRIGDIVLSTPVLRGLRELHPDAEIHLVINAQFKQVAALVPYIDRVIHFDREKLQIGLGEAEVPMFESYERLRRFVEDLNTESYDTAVNLTHSRLSGWLMNVVNANEKIGLCFDDSGRATFGSSWFRYLNNQVESESSEVFHFTDVFRFALQIGEGGVQRPSLVETIAGRMEAGTFIDRLPQGAPIVAVQALTSDIKKDWGLSRFAEALELLQASHPEVCFAVLGAPFEKERLTPLMERLEKSGVRAALGILSFEGAYSLLRRAKLLVSGDTSIKHLASAARTPVLEISLGSSDYHRTGAYLQGSVIIQSREACAPCVHSKPCHRLSHACAARIPVEAVSMVAGEILNGRVFQLKTIAEEYREEIDVLRVEMRASGFWAAYSVLEPFAEQTVGRWLDLTCRKLWLESVQAKGRGSLETLGSEILGLSRLLRTIHPETTDEEWRHLLGDFERQALMIETRINGFKVGLQHLHGCYEDPRQIRDFVKGLISLRERIRHSPLLQSFKILLDAVIEDDISPAFTRFRRISDVVVEIERRTSIHLRLIRGLNAQMESGKGLEKS